MKCIYCNNRLEKERKKLDICLNCKVIIWYSKVTPKPATYR